MSTHSMLRRALTSNHLPKSVLLSRLRGTRPYAKNAAAAAEEPNPDGPKSRGGRRLSKQDRKALVQSFVNEYRAMNGGEFPHVKLTQEQVGGGFYRVRGILQELQYAAKTSPSCGGIEHSLGREGIRGSESLAEIGGVSARTVAEAKNDADLNVGGDGCLEAKEESRTLSSVEILSEEVITPGRGSDLDVTQNNIGQVNAEESSYIGSHKVGNGMEEHKTCEMLQGELQVISHSLDISEESKTEEDQADRHDCVSREKHLQIGEANTASPSSEDTEDATKAEEAQADQLDSIAAEKHLPVEETNRPTSFDDTDDVTNADFDDSKCKMEQHEQILQADRLDFVVKEEHLSIGETNRASPTTGNADIVTKSDLDDSKSKVEQHEEIPQAEKLSKDHSHRPANDAQPPKTSTTLWGAMKSLADGIISIFRQ